MIMKSMTEKLNERIKREDKFWGCHVQHHYQAVVPFASWRNASPARGFGASPHGAFRYYPASLQYTVFQLGFYPQCILHH